MPMPEDDDDDVDVDSSNTNGCACCWGNIFRELPSDYQNECMKNYEMVMCRCHAALKQQQRQQQ
ncbi:GH23708 [Drosophila grimshawi]|uniref:GH23708 n=1 Tax=Drosophila grimshawi TaxID=7222 RepID=B4K2T7_DROGR|nr:GH23708 [Drosophila grimshawi]